MIFIDNMVDIIKKKPEPRYLLAKQKEYGYFEMVKVGFD